MLWTSGVRRKSIPDNGKGVHKEKGLGGMGGRMHVKEAVIKKELSLGDKDDSCDSCSPYLLYLVAVY